MIKALWDAGAHLKGRSALQIAAGYGRLDCIALFLKRGADIDETPNNKDLTMNEQIEGTRNAPCEAAWKGQLGAVDMLLGLGANAGLRNTKGKTP